MNSYDLSTQIPQMVIFNSIFPFLQRERHTQIDREVQIGFVLSYTIPLNCPVRASKNQEFFSYITTKEGKTLRHPSGFP